MRNFSLLGATALLTASAIAVEEGYNMDMPCFNDICFTSWKCWYPRVSKYDNTIDARCNIPHHVYTPANDGTRWNTMVWDSSYYVTWKSSYETQGEDVVLEWLMFETPGLPLPPLANEGSVIMDRYGSGPVKYIVAHSMAVPKYSGGQNFSPRLSDFPNIHLNASLIEVTGYAMERNAFRIYHPNTFDPRNGSTWDMSEGFSVIRKAEEAMIIRAAENHIQSGKKKLAIGVGVGVTVSWFVAFLVAWFTSTWFQKRMLVKKGYWIKIVGTD